MVIPATEFGEFRFEFPALFNISGISIWIFLHFLMGRSRREKLRENSNSPNPVVSITISYIESKMSQKMWYKIFFSGFTISPCHSTQNSDYTKSSSLIRLQTGKRWKSWYPEYHSSHGWTVFLDSLVLWRFIFPHYCYFLGSYTVQKCAISIETNAFRRSHIRYGQRRFENLS